MTELFPVTVNSGQLPLAGDRPVVFHGVNKSGSLAMSKVISDSYHAGGRANQFFSTYQHVPQDTDQFVRLLRCSSGHGFFVSHYIYPGVELRDEGFLVTQLRHPLPRVVSVHGWLKRNHIREHGTADGFPDLESWIRRFERGSKAPMQMSHFAVGFPAGWGSQSHERDAAARAVRKRELDALTPEAMYEKGLEALERDFVWYGIADLFEESIFALAYICGLDAVPAWLKDTRNKWRESLTEVEPHIIELVAELLPYELKFYETALAKFLERISTVEFGPSLAPYKERCRGEYADRMITPEELAAGAHPGQDDGPSVL